MTSWSHHKASYDAHPGSPTLVRRSPVSRYLRPEGAGVLAAPAHCNGIHPQISSDHQNVRLLYGVYLMTCIST